MMSPLPSVTAILAAVGLAPDFKFVDDSTLEHARQRGKALHKAIALYHKGTLDESSLHEEVLPGFEAYRRFVKDTGHDMLCGEVELEHPTWGFIGHPDDIGSHGHVRRAVYDFKYTAGFDKEYVRLQTAGYRLLWDALNPEDPIERCFGLHLKRDGTYAIHDLTDDNAKQVFLASVIVYRALQERGKV